MNNIEQLLSVPMTDIEDQGFSAEVISKIARFNHLRLWILSILYAFLALFFIAFFPVFSWLKTVKTFISSQNLSTSSLVINNQLLIEVISQPTIVLTLSVAIIVIFTRLES